MSTPRWEEDEKSHFMHSMPAETGQTDTHTHAVISNIAFAVSMIKSERLNKNRVGKTSMIMTYGELAIVSLTSSRPRSN
jgi:hypothetical protein